MSVSSVETYVYDRTRAHAYAFSLGSRTRDTYHIHAHFYILQKLWQTQVFGHGRWLWLCVVCGEGLRRWVAESPRPAPHREDLLRGRSDPSTTFNSEAWPTQLDKADTVATTFCRCFPARAALSSEIWSPHPQVSSLEWRIVSHPALGFCRCPLRGAGRLMIPRRLCKLVFLALGFFILARRIPDLSMCRYMFGTVAVSPQKLLVRRHAVHRLPYHRLFVPIRRFA